MEVCGNMKIDAAFLIRFRMLPHLNEVFNVQSRKPGLGFKDVGSPWFIKTKRTTVI